MSLSPEIIKRSLYPPETFTEARLINLVAGARNLFSEFSDIPPNLLRLKEIGTQRNAAVTVVVEGDYGSKRYNANLLTDTIEDWDNNTPLDVYFDDKGLVRFNSTGAVANYPARTIYEVKPYSAADKLFLRSDVNALDVLDASELEAVEKYQVVERLSLGELPMKYPKGELVYEYLDNFDGALAAGDAGEQTVCELSVPQGYKGVIRGIWTNRPALNVTALTLRIWRERTHIFDIFPACLPNMDATEAGGIVLKVSPTWLWIVGLKHLRVTIRSGTGHAGVKAFAKIELRRLTLFDKAAWGLRKDRAITAEWEDRLIDEYDLMTKLKAGVYEYRAPVRE